MENKKKRIVKATKAFCDEAENKDLEICSWEEMPGFDSFVEGRITEAELAEQAQDEMAQFVKKFEKYTVIQRDVSTVDEKKEAKLKKAKVANKIYRKACAETGKSLCFFNNFTSWQEFVEGRIGDGELYDKAREEIEKLAQTS